MQISDARCEARIYGYARISTEAQDLISQFAQLKAAGCEKVFRGKITETTTDRPHTRGERRPQ